MLEDQLKTYDYIPRKIKDEEGNLMDQVFTGKVTIEVPFYRERLEIGRIVQGDGKESNVDISMKTLEILKKHVKEVDITCDKHDLIIDNFDDLGLYQEGGAIITDLIQILIKGIPLGEGSGPS